MRLGALATVLLALAAAIPMAGGPARAQTQDQAKSPPAPATEATPAAPETSSQAAPAAAPPITPEPSPSVPADTAQAVAPEPAPAAATEAPPAPAEASPAAVLDDPVVAAISAKLADLAAKDAHSGDLAALTEFFASRDGPLWVTEMGFSAKGQ